MSLTLFGPLLISPYLLYSRGGAAPLPPPPPPQLLPPPPPASPKLRCRTHRFRGKEKYFPWLLWRDKLAAATAARGENGGALPGHGRDGGKGEERGEEEEEEDDGF